MWDAIFTFFSQPPPALDPVFIPWVTALIAGNIIIFSGLWAFLKYIAKATPWAGDDKVLQILTGAFGALMGVIKPSPEVECVEEEAHEEGVLCPTCHKVL